MSRYFYIWRKNTKIRKGHQLDQSKIHVSTDLVPQVPVTGMIQGYLIYKGDLARNWHFGKKQIVSTQLTGENVQIRQVSGRLGDTSPRQA